ncbi:MAG: alpha/beta hydrolase [Alphaproteobacteria bacterium]|nr:alpha/beta hydrolase [Alphaproteobacteria bacterium]
MVTSDWRGAWLGALAVAAAAFVPGSGAAAAAEASNPDSRGAIESLPALTGAYFPLASEHTGRTYHIHVRVPDGYDPQGAQIYPVVYVLDGDSLWPILAATHLFLTYDDGVPEAIVVGIAYGSFSPEINARSVDFMPPGAEEREAGAPAFARFLSGELLPLIEARYNADPGRRIVFGQSRGGSFVLYSAFTDPDLFWGRIASNPAFAPTEEFFFAEPLTASRPDLKLMIASGENDWPVSRQAALRWGAAWDERPGRPWDARVHTIPGGTHAANSADAYRAGLRWIFSE